MGQVVLHPINYVDMYLENEDLYVENKSNGSPYHQGRFDSYYNRLPKPHKWEGTTEVFDLTEDEVLEYVLGYFENDEQKDWGE